MADLLKPGDRKSTFHFRSPVNDDLITMNVYFILDVSELNVIKPPVFDLLASVRKGLCLQEIVQNLPNFLKGQVILGDDVEKKILVIKRVDFHVFPQKEFGPILTKNDFSIKIFFVLE